MFQMKATMHDILFSKKWVPIVDYAKEAATSDIDARECFKKTYQMIKDLHDLNTVFPIAYALKASSFKVARNGDGARYIDELAAKVLEYRTTTVMLDAEQDYMKAYERDMYDRVVAKYNGREARVYKTYQMYRRDGMKLLAEDLDKHPNLGIKLVRGAYMKEDIHVMHASLQQTHNAYDRAINSTISSIIQSEDSRDLRLLVASHNANSVRMAARITCGRLGHTVAFAQLLGMGDILSHELSKQERMVYKYVPYGTVKEVIPYLLRRFRENLA